MPIIRMPFYRFTKKRQKPAPALALSLVDRVSRSRRRPSSNRDDPTRLLLSLAGRRAERREADKGRGARVKADPHGGFAMAILLYRENPSKEGMKSRVLPTQLPSVIKGRKEKIKEEKTGRAVRVSPSLSLSRVFTLAV